MDATESFGDSMLGDRLSKRRRVKTTRYDLEFVENEEHIMLQQVSFGDIRILSWYGRWNTLWNLVKKY